MIIILPYINVDTLLTDLFLLIENISWNLFSKMYTLLLYFSLGPGMDLSFLQSPFCKECIFGSWSI
jgi:hypothetical protein